MSNQDSTPVPDEVASNPSSGDGRPSTEDSLYMRKYSAKVEVASRAQSPGGGLLAALGRAHVRAHPSSSHLPISSHHPL